ncbi:MAG: hypothetical protein HY720_08670 [Planctomycetes bacterium]|nr:hypothetical protein [Planctomycetota bacterium]
MFRRPGIAHALVPLHCVRLEFSADRPARERLDVYGTPVLLVLDGEGRVLDRVDGFVPPDELAGWLEKNLH